MAEQEPAYEILEKKLGYPFQDRSLIREALTHPSFTFASGNRPQSHYQRLEFLGDAILGMVLAEQLFQLYPDAREGFLSRARASLIRGTTLARIAAELEIAPFLFMGKAEKNANQQHSETALEDVLEALVAAIYLDGGFPTCKTCILKWYNDIPARLEYEDEHYNPKGQLQEWVHKNNHDCDLPQYTIVDKHGPDHAKQYTAKVSISDHLYNFGSGSSKKEAEEEAAIRLLKHLLSLRKE